MDEPSFFREDDEVPQVLRASGRWLHLGFVHCVFDLDDRLGKLFADSLAGAGLARDEPCDLRVRQAQHQASASVCRESADQGRSSAARQVQFPVGPYDEQLGCSKHGVLLRAAIWLDHDAVAAHVGTFARLFRRALVDGRAVRFRPWDFELCRRACDLDSALRRDRIHLNFFAVIPDLFGDLLTRF